MAPETIEVQEGESAVAAMGLRARKQIQTKNALWDAAIDLFAEKGFEETTIDEIADAAQVSRRSFFRYFESKNDLMAQPIVNLVDSISRAVTQCPESAPPSELFHYVVSALAQQSAAEVRTAKVMEIAEKCPAARDALLSRMSTVQNQIEQAFRKRCKANLTVQVISSLTLSALSLSTRHWFANGQKKIDVSTRKVLASIADIACGPDGARG
jgi:AcrR family transcriptional regulator